ncbi:hypothetical protein ACTHPH_01635 [Paenibacillus pasadenensis]|uniref:hypothetical protein n=1 Tax=Paenibacillus pasadenensis TaxID=217090 RepID=UPI0003FC2703|nr:hypothetical protein [Paenibacillus pasadenensis]
MNPHPPMESWSRYAAGLGGAPERLAMERHLESCELCLEAFQAAALAEEPARDECPKQAALAERLRGEALERVRAAVLDELAREQADAERRPPPRRRSWTRHPAFHYGLAAALTLLLLGSGALGELGRQLEHAASARPPQPSLSTERPDAGEESWSSRVVDRTSRLLQEWQSARYRDGGAS